MCLSGKAVFLTAVLTASLALHGQEHPRFSDPNLLAKLSFDNSGAVLTPGIQHMCIAVSRDGTYRMMRSPVLGMLHSNPARLTQRVRGTMSGEQLQRLKALLDSSDLRSISGNHSGIIRQSAEIFAAEIPALGKEVSNSTLHIQWLDADGQSPFPGSVNKIVDWLNDFEPVNAKPLADLEFQDVCPSVGLQRLQPSVASNLP